jgi:hypothetical protein
MYTLKDILSHLAGVFKPRQQQTLTLSQRLQAGEIVKRGDCQLICCVDTYCMNGSPRGEHLLSRLTTDDASLQAQWDRYCENSLIVAASV